MSEIDLIPEDYRYWLRQQSLLRQYAIGFLVFNLLVFATSVALGQSAKRAQGEAVRLRAENAVTQQQQMQLQQLKEQQAEFERRWSLLRGLRAGAAIDDIFSLIDRSLVPGELWFVDWSFRRAGVIVDGQQRGVETGYFIIVPDGTDPVANPDLEVETHMTIHGQARDHQALSKFVRTLFEQRDIKDVNVQRTSQTEYANGRVVEFDLTIVLNSTSKES